MGTATFQHLRSSSLTCAESLLEQADLAQFSTASIILRLATTYEAPALRAEVLRELQVFWPTTLHRWEARERNASDAAGTYSPGAGIVHPM